MLEIRRMTQEDIPALIHLGGIMHDESEYRAMEYSPEKCAQLGYRALEDENILVLTVLDGEERIGLMIGTVQAPEFSNDLFAWDILVYVHPDYRGTRAAYLMLKGYKIWAMERGAKMIFLRTSTNIEPEKTGKMFEKLGFRFVGSNYLMEV